jgi:hypothetical protein
MGVRPLGLQVVFLVVMVALFTVEAEAERMVIELSDLSEDGAHTSSPLRARLGESAAENPLNAAVNKALKTGSTDAVKELLKDTEAAAAAKAAATKAKMSATPSEAQQIVAEMEDPANTKKKRASKKATLEDKIHKKLSSLLRRFEVADDANTARKLKVKISKLRRKLQHMDRVKQLALSKLQIANEKAQKMHRKFNIAAPGTLAKLRNMNAELDTHITALDGQNAVDSAEIEKAHKLEDEKTMISVKLSQNTELLKDKETKVKALTEKLKQAQAQEAVLQSEQQLASGKIQAAKAVLTEDQAQVAHVQNVYDTQLRQVKSLEDEVAQAITSGDQSRINSLRPALDQQKATLEQSKISLAAATGAEQKAESSLAAASRLAIVNDELAQERYEQQLEAAKAAKEASLKNETAAATALSAANAEKESAAKALEEMSAAPGANQTIIKQLDSALKNATSKADAAQEAVTEAKNVLNSTVTANHAAVAAVTDSANIVHVDKELAAEKLESTELKKEVEAAKSEQAAVASVVASDKQTLAVEQAEVESQEKEAKANSEASKLVATQEAEMKKVEEVEANSKKKEQEIEMDEKQVEVKAEDQKQASEEAKADAKALRSKEGELRKTKDELKQLQRDKGEKEAQLAISTVPAERDLLTEDLKDISTGLTEMSAKAAQLDKEVESSKTALDTRIQKAQQAEASVDAHILNLRVEAGKSLTMAAFRKADAGIKQLEAEAAEAAKNLKSAENGGVEEPETVTPDNAMVEQALAAAAQVTDSGAGELLNTATKELAIAEDTPPAVVVVEAPPTGAASASAAANAAKIQDIENAKMMAKSQALQQAELQAEGDKLQASAKTAEVKSSLDKMLADLKGHSQTIAKANADAEALNEKLAQVEDAGEKSRLEVALREKREIAAKEHVQSETLVARIAAAKTQMHSVNERAAKTARKNAAVVTAAQHASASATAEAKQAAVTAASQADAAAAIQDNRVKSAKLASERVRVEKSNAEQTVAALEKKATEANPAQLPQVTAELEAEKVKVEELASKADQAAANVASAEQAKAAADTQRLEGLVGKTKEAAEESRNAAADTSAKRRDQQNAEIKVQAQKAEVARVQAALDLADTPEKAAALSTKLAAAEHSAAQAEQAEQVAAAKVATAKKTQQAVQHELAKDKSQVSLVKAPYEAKSSATKSAVSQEDYEKKITDAMHRSGLKIEGKSEEWISQQAQQLAAADQNSAAEAAETAKHLAQTRSAVAAATKPLEAKVTELDAQNKALEQQLTAQVSLQTASEKKSDQVVRQAFEAMSKEATQTRLGESDTSSGSDLQSVVDAAVAGGGKQGALSSMLASLEDTADLGEGMSDDHQLLDDIYEHFAQPTTLLQTDENGKPRWVWKGPIPAGGMPSAPKTPTSTSADELYHQAVAKADKIAQSNMVPAPVQTESPVEDVTSAKAEVAAAAKQVELDTQAMNDSPGSAQALALAKKIEESKRLLSKAKKAETKAVNQAAENAVQEQKARLEQHEAATGASPAAIQATEASAAALKGALEGQSQAEQTVEKDEAKIGVLNTRLIHATSAEEVDDLTSQVDKSKKAALKAKAQLQVAVTSVSNAGLQEILSGVQAGAVSGVAAVEAVKKVELDKSKEEMALAASSVARVQAQVDAAEAQLHQNKDAIEKVKAAAAATSANPDAAKVAATEIDSLHEQGDQAKETLRQARRNLKREQKRAKEVLKQTESQGAAVEQAAQQELRSVQRSERKETAVMQDVARKVKKAAVKEGAYEAASVSMKKEAMAAEKASKDATSAVIGRQAAREAKEADEDERVEKVKAEHEQRILEKEKIAASVAKKKLIGVITKAVHKVALGEKKAGTRASRKAAREAKQDAKAAAAAKEKQDTADNQVSRVQEKIVRRKARLAKNEGEVAKLKAKEKESTIQHGDEAEKAKAADEQLNVKAELKQEEAAVASMKSDVKRAQAELRSSKAKSEALSRASAKAQRRAERAAKRAKKAARKLEKAPSQPGAGDNKAARLAQAVEAKAQAVDNAQEAEDERAVAKAESEEVKAKEEMASGVPSGEQPSVEVLAAEFLTKAGFQVVGGLA